MNVDDSIQGRRRFVISSLLSCLGLPFGFALGQTVSGPIKRTALIMGNGAYAFGRLKNPVNDVRGVAGALEPIGFEVVTLEDGDLTHMLDAMKEFIARGKDSPVRLFFYAGHGIQAKGKNYLVPVDAQMIEENKLTTQLVSVSEFIEKLSLLKSGANIVILDACRTGLSAAAARRRGVNNKRSPQSGLAQMDAPQGTLIAFSTAPGSVALDGASQNSTYTRHLLESMSVPGLPVEQLFKRVRISVAQETQQAQIPWETSSLMGNFCFRTDTKGGCSSLIDGIPSGAGEN
ncbi:MAG: caspase family protein [Burkholderiales bacterium]